MSVDFEKIERLGKKLTDDDDLVVMFLARDSKRLGPMR